MTNAIIAARYAQARKRFAKAPEHIREDIVEAAIWARDTLRDHEGAGHIIQVSESKGLVVCSFCKPQWNADHCGETMETGSEAIVMAVCEYLSGC